MNQRLLKFLAWHEPSQRLFAVHSFNDSFVYEAFPSGAESNVGTFPRQHCILLQFTGITDKHGVELYEGHIIETRFKDEFAMRGESIVHNEIAFRNGSFGLVGENTGELETFFNLGITDQIKDAAWVGNIFEHGYLVNREEEEDDETWQEARFVEIGDITPLRKGKLSNWLDYQNTFIQMQKADKFSDDTIKATNWVDIQEWFKADVSAKDAYRYTYYDKPNLL